MTIFLQEYFYRGWSLDSLGLDGTDLAGRALTFPAQVALRNAISEVLVSFRDARLSLLIFSNQLVEQAIRAGWALVLKSSSEVSFRFAETRELDGYAFVIGDSTIIRTVGHDHVVA